MTESFLPIPTSPKLKPGTKTSIPSFAIAGRAMSMIRASVPPWWSKACPRSCRWDDLHRGSSAGEDRHADALGRSQSRRLRLATRLATRIKDGVVGEVIFPSVGMLLVLHPDADYKKACFDAYNRHLVKYCSINPQRLIGVPQVAIRTIDKGIQELEQAKAMGFKAVMVPGEPIYKDYDHPDYDAFYEAAVALSCPGFPYPDHQERCISVGRGPHICGHQRFVRGNQDIISMLVFSGVFERHPKLRIVSVESDASWIPHYGMRMDAAYNHHRYWEQVNLSKMRAPTSMKTSILPSKTITRGKMTELLPMDRIMFASDFPHSDGIWPHSKEVADRLTKTMSDTHARMITHDNVAKLYGITV